MLIETIPPGSIHKHTSLYTFIEGAGAVVDSSVGSQSCIITVGCIHPVGGQTNGASPGRIVALRAKEIIASALG